MESKEEEHKRTEGARTKAATAGLVKGDSHLGGEWKFQVNPPFLQERVQVWDELFAK